MFYREFKNRIHLTCSTMTFSYYLVLIVIRSIPALSDPPNNCVSSSSNPTGNDQIDHSHFLVNDISDLYLNERFSDIVLVVDNERLHVHRLVLASRSEYFSALFYRGYSESDKANVTINEASAVTFKILLQYIYTGRINLSILQDQVILELFSISDFFGLPNLQLTLSEYLRRKINVHNVCSMLAAARLYKHTELELESLNFIDTHANDVLQSEDFLFSSPEALLEILNRDSLYAYELDIFRAVCRWIDRRPEGEDPEAKTRVLSAVRYSLMSDDELMSEVRDSNLVTLDTISDAVQLRTTLPPHKLKVRGTLVPNVNLVHIFEPIPVIDESVGSTTIKFDQPSNINYIEMVLSGGDVEFYCYYIEVSMDQEIWKRVIDHTNYHCRSIQRLWIHPRVVRYIRIVGTKNTGTKTFDLLKVMYNTEEMHKVVIEKGLVVPKYNVALLSMNANLIKGENNSKEHCYILDGDYKEFGRFYGFTYHQLGSGCILVQLAQPYMLNSIRMRLWDRANDRFFGYIVEVSVNNEDWETVVDKSNESARSWQLLQFQPMPIVYIRITGVHTSETEYFSCVYLEAPAQEAEDNS